MNKKAKKSKNNGRMSRSIANDPFLQCAFASCDFELDKVRGVPDNYSGRTVVKRHRFVGTIANTAGNDTHLVCLPSPGIAYYQSTTTSAATLPSNNVFSAVGYPDSQVLFPTGQEDVNVIKARHVGKFVELIPTVNATSWSGAVTCWKVPITMAYSGRGTGDLNPTYNLVGSSGISAPSGSNYVAGNNMGVYAVAGCLSGDHVFNPILRDVRAIPTLQSVTTGDWGIFVGGFNGLLDTETIVIKITGNAQYIIKVHDCIEYQVPNTSILFDYSSASADFNPAALIAYKEIRRNLPVAVSYFENATFWETVLKIFNRATAMGSFIPGPIGMMSQGANLMGVAAASLLV